MKTHKGTILNTFDDERNEIQSSDLAGVFYNGYTTMKLHNLTSDVEGKDLVYDVMLKELVNHKQALLEGKDVAIGMEWTISDDNSTYLSATVRGVTYIN